MIDFYQKNVCKSPVEECHFKGALSGLRQFSTTETPLKMMKNAFFHLKSSFRFQVI